MNKIMKVIYTLVGLILVLWGIIFAIDYVKCSNFKEPIFVIAGETADDGGSGTYYGLGYKVKIEKNISTEYGVQLVKVEMYMFNKFITGAIADVVNVTGEENNSNTVTTNSFIGTVLEETTTYMIVESNEDEVEVTVDNKTMPLESDLRSEKITIDGILAKANKDEKEGKIKVQCIKMEKQKSGTIMSIQL